jgi:hypothetical protein
MEILTCPRCGFHIITIWTGHCPIQEAQCIECEYSLTSRERDDPFIPITQKELDIFKILDIEKLKAIVSNKYSITLAMWDCLVKAYPNVVLVHKERWAIDAYPLKEKGHYLGVGDTADGAIIHAFQTVFHKFLTQ